MDPGMQFLMIMALAACGAIVVALLILTGVFTLENREQSPLIGERSVRRLLHEAAVNSSPEEVATLSSSIQSDEQHQHAA